MFLPLSYDEAYWLGIWRMWSGGGTLYSTAIDNKSPVVYLVYGFLDAFPGSFQIARGLFVGFLVFLVGWLADYFQRPYLLDRALFTAMLVVTAVLSEFRLYTELMAAPLIVAALGNARSGRLWLGGLLAVAASALTPLAVGTLAVVAMLGWRGFRSTMLSLLPAFSLAAAIGACILLLDNARFGLVEMNLASRQSLGTLTGASEPLERFVFVTMALLPLALFGYLRTWPQETWIRVWIASAVPLAAGWFPHYFIVSTSTALGLDDGRGVERTGSRRRLMVWAILPLVLSSLLLQQGYWRTASRYASVVSHIDLLSKSDWDFMQFDLQPYVTTQFPGRALLRSPSINYLVWETSLSDVHRSEIPQLLGDAEVLLEPGLEGDLDVPPSVAHLVGPFLDAIPDFDCSFEVEHLTVHLREPLCEIWIAGGSG